MRKPARIAIFVSLMSIVAGAVTLFGHMSAGPPADPFSPWNGRWRGEFICYDISGRERYRLQVEQEYRPAGSGQQSVVFTNRAASGSVEIVHAVNLVQDGEMICRIRTIGPDGKAAGEPIEHHGRLIGSGHIIWHRRIGQYGFETFNEIIDGDTYWIHGVGLSGDDPRKTEIYEGRYIRLND